MADWDEEVTVDLFFLTTIWSISRGIISPTAMISLVFLLLSANLVLGQEEHDHDHDHHAGNPLDWLRDSVPGEPGVDYPIFNEVQETSFNCADRVFGGYYADPEMLCQGYHVCLSRGPGARKISFLCPNGTIFNQEKFTCEWWFNLPRDQPHNHFLRDQPHNPLHRRQNPNLLLKGLPLNLLLREQSHNLLQRGPPHNLFLNAQTQHLHLKGLSHNLLHFRIILQFKSQLFPLSFKSPFSQKNRRDPFDPLPLSKGPTIVDQLRQLQQLQL
eukprot:maker-scaffold553_size137994-snap-gene-0.15 protein:Tk12060 transcript:maker-scaffold553_size137994-snap-gene-0.15-mRNA-1 annotation:"homeobox protein 2-like"